MVVIYTLGYMIRLFNTLTKTKEEFRPLHEKKVGMYHCGPTVYNYAHIGNLRAYVTADIIRRVFEYNHYHVNQVINITDVGHLVSDEDTGEDKMSKGLSREKLSPTIENMIVLGEKYTTAFVEDLKSLNILLPHHMPRASDHIQEDISIIQKLDEKKFTYLTSDGIYFDTSKDPEYGKLAGVLSNTDGHRIEEHKEKRNPRDFALWKFDESNGWNSPWGKGFPGWHIECSGMSMKYLGETFDLHTGGIDHIPIHHTNEIAQSENATGKPLAQYWMHNAFVNMHGEKMAKSDENFTTLRTLIEKGYDPLVYRFWLLQANYRTPMDFSYEALNSAQKGLQSLKKAVGRLSESTGGMINSSWKERFLEAINDDFGTATALAITQELLKQEKLSEADRYATILDFDKILGLRLYEAIQDKESEENLPEEVRHLVTQRDKARKEKNWETSDALRKEIENSGFEVLDTKEGQRIVKKS